jgi:hypothetical protein
MQQQNIKPRYEVEFVDETVIETHVKREDGRNIEHEVEVPYGYNVYFPAGHSIRVRTTEELKRLGFDVPAELIDEDGEVVGTTQQMSLKKNVNLRAQASKRRKAETGAIDANQ